MNQTINTCYLCINGKHNITSIHTFDTDSKYIDKLKFVFPDITLPENNATLLICIECSEKLGLACMFKKQCLNSLSHWDDKVNMKVEINMDKATNSKEEATEKDNDNEVFIKSELENDRNDDSNESDSSEYPSNDDDNDDDYKPMNLKTKDVTVVLDNVETVTTEAGKRPMQKVDLKTRTKVKILEVFANIDSNTYINDKNNKVFMCVKCNKKLANSHILRRHMIRHYSHLSPYKCDLCGKGFGCKYELNSHLLSHQDDRPFQCEVCAKGFKIKSVLTMHMRAHTGATKYVCDFCGKKFYKISALKSHLNVHSEVRNYECKICDKKFKVKGTYKAHMDAHMNREFACKLCDKTFNSSRKLRSHTIRHTSEKQFKCDICEKAYFEKGQLKIHLTAAHSIEKKHSCGICYKQFALKCVLKNHMRVHSGEKPYQCSDCGKCFAHSGTLGVHRRLHTGVRPYVCTVCEKGFIKSHHLEHHMKKHESI